MRWAGRGLYFLSYFWRNVVTGGWSYITGCWTLNLSLAVTPMTKSQTNSPYHRSGVQQCQGGNSYTLLAVVWRIMIPSPKPSPISFGDKIVPAWEILFIYLFISIFFWGGGGCCCGHYPEYFLPWGYLAQKLDAACSNSGAFARILTLFTWKIENPRGGGCWPDKPIMCAIVNG